MSVKDLAAAFDDKINTIVKQLVDERDNTHELARQLQAASEARIKWLQEQIEAMTAEIEAEKARATAAAAELDARHRAFDAIMAGEAKP